MLQMIHVSEFLKVMLQDDSHPSFNNLSCAIVSSSNIDNYCVVGLVAECQLTESPVIMELTIQHSTFTIVVSLDMKFTSVDTRCVLLCKSIQYMECEYIISQCMDRSEKPLGI